MILYGYNILQQIKLSQVKSKLTTLDKQVKLNQMKFNQVKLRVRPLLCINSLHQFPPELMRWPSYQLNKSIIKFNMAE